MANLTIYLSRELGSARCTTAPTFLVGMISMSIGHRILAPARGPQRMTEVPGPAASPLSEAVTVVDLTSPATAFLP